MVFVQFSYNEVKKILSFAKVMLELIGTKSRTHPLKSTDESQPFTFSYGANELESEHPCSSLQCSKPEALGLRSVSLTVSSD